MQQSIKRKIEKLIPEAMQKYSVPGLGIGIIKNGEIIYTRGFGLRNLEESIPFTPDSLYGIGSTSKAFTALAIMQLVEQGKINLQDPIEQYLDFNLQYNGNPIRIHHVLSHSSGLPELQATSLQFDYIQGQISEMIPMGSKEDFYLYLNGANSELFHEPGEKFFYNNDLYACLADLIEEVSGLSHSNYITKNILKPLGMTRSTYEAAKFHKDPKQNMTTGYFPGGKNGPLRPFPYPFLSVINGPGGLISSINEMLKFMKMLLNCGKIKDELIISEESLNLMTTPHIEAPVPYVLNKGGYGYGLMIEEDFYGTKLIHHGGNMAISSGDFLFLPEKNIGIVYGLNNGAADALSTTVKSILAMMIDIDSEITFKQLNLITKLKRLEGEYATYRNLTKIKIQERGGNLYLKPPQSENSNHPGQLLIPKKIDNYEFYFQVGSRKIPGIFSIHPKSGEILFYQDRYIFHKKK